MGDPRLLLQHAAAPTTFFEILTGTPLQPMYRQHLSDASRVEVLGRGRAIWAPVSPGRVRVLRFVVPFQSGTQPQFRAYRFDPHVAGAGALQVVAQHSFAM